MVVSGMSAYVRWNDSKLTQSILNVAESLGWEENSWDKPVLRGNNKHINIGDQMYGYVEENVLKWAKAFAKEIPKCNLEIDVNVDNSYNYEVYQIAIANEKCEYVRAFGSAENIYKCRFCGYEVEDDLVRKLDWRRDDYEDTDNMVFAISGEMKYFTSLNALKHYILLYLGNEISDLSSTVDYLICNEDITSDIHKKAMELGVPVISEKEFLMRFTQEIDDLENYIPLDSFVLVRQWNDPLVECRCPKCNKEIGRGYERNIYDIQAFVEMKIDSN